MDKQEKNPNIRSLQGVNELDRTFIFTEWFKQIKETRTFDEGLEIVRSIYNSGFYDGYHLGTGDQSWDE